VRRPERRLPEAAGRFGLRLVLEFNFAEHKRDSNLPAQTSWSGFYRMVGMTHFQDAGEARDACDVLESGATKIELVAAAGKILRLRGHGRPTAALDAGSEPMFRGKPR
jgi:hypothetical protein